MDMAKRAERLIGQDDLYGALRAAAAGLTLAGADSLLPALQNILPEAKRARLAQVDTGLLRAVIRRGAGLPAVPGAAAVRAHLVGADVAPMFLPGIGISPRLALLTKGQQPDMPAFSDRGFDAWFAPAPRPGAVLWLWRIRRKASHVYATDQFADAASPERRTRHTGIDVFTAAGTPVHAPLPGTVAYVTYNADPLDYGHTLILRHATRTGVPFYTPLRPSGRDAAGPLPGWPNRAPGQLIAHLGDWHENGGWAPHLHFQIMTDILAQTEGNFFGVGHDSLWDVWSGICIDPNLILRLPQESFLL